MKKKICFMIFFLFMVSNMVQAKRPVPYIQKDYRNSLKITFLSWISGSTKLSYERSFPNIHQSGELCASIIGAGRDKYRNDPKGYTMRYGHKFFLNENQKNNLMNLINLFKNNRNYIIMIRKDCAEANYKTLEEALVNLLEK